MVLFNGLFMWMLLLFRFFCNCLFLILLLFLKMMLLMVGCLVMCMISVLLLCIIVIFLKWVEEYREWISWVIWNVFSLLFFCIGMYVNVVFNVICCNFLIWIFLIINLLLLDVVFVKLVLEYKSLVIINWLNFIYFFFFCCVCVFFVMIVCLR